MGNSASADTSDLISSLGMLYRNPLHLELPFCNNYNPDNLSVQDQYSFSFTQHSKYIMSTASQIASIYLHITMMWLLK